MALPADPRYAPDVQARAAIGFNGLQPRSAIEAMLVDFSVMRARERGSAEARSTVVAGTEITPSALGAPGQGLGMLSLAELGMRPYSLATRRAGGTTRFTRWREGLTLRRMTRAPRLARGLPLGTAHLLSPLEAPSTLGSTQCADLQQPSQPLNAVPTPQSVDERQRNQYGPALPDDLAGQEVQAPEGEP